MAKGQMRTSKQTKKPKTAEKPDKKAGPKYLRTSEIGQTSRLGAQKPGTK